MFVSLLVLLLTSVVAADDAVLSCSADVIPKPDIYGSTILSLTAQANTNYGGISGNDVCSVTVSLTHEGTGDLVNNVITLPLKNWNGRFQGIGGGGYVAGNPFVLPTVASQGYSSGITDAGHEISLQAVGNSTPWAQSSPGNVNQQALYNFARRSVHDMTVIGKALSESFYGKKPAYSYWNGCSTGGRQGLALAQYYPDAYDGILPDAPAIQFTALATYGAYIWSVLTAANYFPDACEVQGVADATLEACDALDGLKDGLMQAPGLCNFDPSTLAGKTYTCANGTQITFSSQVGALVKQVWAGPKTPQGQFLWYGLIKSADFSALYSDPVTSAPLGHPQSIEISDTWVKNFLAKDLNFDTNAIPLSEYADLFLQAHLEYDSIVASASPNLRRFKKRGGKMITWQGLADQVVPPQGTILYYQTVQALDRNVQDFYRLYFSPGIGHCFGGPGPYPTDELGQLRAWVENGTAPETLKAATPYAAGANVALPVNGTNVRFMELCPYPKVNKYNGYGDANLASSYSCLEQWGWEQFAGPNGWNYNFFTSPGWYGGDSNFTSP